VSEGTFCRYIEVDPACEATPKLGIVAAVLIEGKETKKILGKFSDPKSRILDNFYRSRSRLLYSALVLQSKACNGSLLISTFVLILSMLISC